MVWELKGEKQEERTDLKHRWREGSEGERETSQ